MRPDEIYWRPRLGIYGRVMVAHYLWHIQVTFLGLTGIVTAIDISSEIGRVWLEFAHTSSFTAAARVSEYVFYRLLDDGSQVFPVAFVLAIVWAEIEHTLAGRRTMVRTAGLTFRRGLAPLAVVALLSVVTQFALDNVVRPYAFMSLSKQGLGEYGWTYTRDRSLRSVWLAVGGDIVQLRLMDNPAPQMTDVTFYQFSSNGALARVTDAPSVVERTAQPGEWQFVDARVWDFATTHAGDTAGALPDASPRPDMSAGFQTYATLDADLPISPRWLEYRGIAPKYIPLSDLIALTWDPRVPDNAPAYSMWLNLRLAQSFTPGLIAVCLSGIFLVCLDRFGLRAAGAAILVAGYTGFTMTRVLSVVADNAVLPTVVATWFQTGFFLLCAALMIALIEQRDRRYKRMTDPPAPSASLAAQPGSEAEPDWKRGEILAG